MMIGISTALATPRRPSAPSNPLAQFYGTGAGKIAIHLRTDEATLNGSNAATALKNIGGAGSVFNATVSGTPLVVNADKTLALSGSTGTPILANTATLMNVRFFWVCTTDSLISSGKFFGSNGYELRLGSFQADGLNFIQFWSNSTGSGVASNPTPRARFPLSGIHLMELEVTPNSVEFWIDGVSQSTSTSAFPWPEFPIDRIGQGNAAGQPYAGNMGDIIGITVGTGSAPAITATRQYIAQRYGITVAI